VTRLRASSPKNRGFFPCRNKGLAPTQLSIQQVTDTLLRGKSAPALKADRSPHLISMYSYIFVCTKIPKVIISNKQIGKGIYIYIYIPLSIYIYIYIPLPICLLLIVIYIFIYMETRGKETTWNT
jgi:hypothetical protein